MSSAEIPELKISSLPQDEYDRRRKLWEAIKILIKSEQEELFRILKRNEVEVTENTNGIFFDVLALPVNVFEAIWKFINFCKSNAKSLEERSKVIGDLSAFTQ